MSDTGWRRKEEFFAHRLLGGIAIAEGRGSDALAEVRRGDVMPDGPAQGCHICFYRDLGYAFDRANQRDSAIVMFERFVRMPSAFSLGTHAGELHIVLRRLGELYESRAARASDRRAARADHMRAVQYYPQFVNLWKNADAELQPQVSDVRRRIGRLSPD